ncbi:hypothetical protein [Demequina sp.]|uniref:hypothetical protein n=1 Tax=Demequina sp. TaxID=2050685 RepID=UPI0025BA2F21|nr:hypothetical protein [Demequina sp.]
MGDSQFRAALRWLAHPVSLAAIGVMALNDHVLKAAYGTWWTGKLSDVAGLVFFPALVAVVLAAVARVLDRDRVRGLDMAAVGITAVGFVWVKATWAGAATASAVLSAIAGPSVVRADATDLLALPALGLAAWVAGRSRTDGRTRRARLKKAVTVAVAPLALLASVATGVSEDSHARIVTDDAGNWRGQVKDAYNYGGDAYYTRTGAGWELYFEDDAIAPPTDGLEPPVLPDREQSEDCVPSDPAVCFRAMTGTTGVERSADGGATWRVDWELSPEDVATLERAYGTRAQEFETRGVGVAEVTDGYVVVAGNGTDGFAVRGVDGEWERVGFVGMECCDWLKTADFDTVDQLPPVHAYPVGFPMGVGLATLALPFLAAALRWGRRSRIHPAASFGAGVAYVFGAFFGVSVLLINSTYAPLTRASPGLDMYMLAPLGGLAMAGVMVAMAAWGLFRRGAVLVTLGGWFAGAVVTGIAVGMAEIFGVHGVRAQVGVGVGALALLYAVYVPVVRLVAAWWRSQAVPQWTRLDAMLLWGIGPGSAPTPLPQVLAQAGFPAGQYPSREQLEVSLGRLAASGVVKISNFVWFRGSAEGKGLVRHAARRGGPENAPDVLLKAMLSVPCRDGRARISDELYDLAVGSDAVAPLEQEEEDPLEQ